MAKKIYKYNVAIKDTQIIEMPEDSRILCVQNQNDKVIIWAIVDENKKNVKRKFVLYGTGHEMKDSYGCHQYVGTFQIHGGSFVGHLFEVEI